MDWHSRKVLSWRLSNTIKTGFREEIYLRTYDFVPEARSRIGDYMRFYNSDRKRQRLGKTPDQAYFGEIMLLEAA